jgi:hypothetical protein
MLALGGHLRASTIATLANGTSVRLRDGQADNLAFPPPVGVVLHVAVNPAALKAPTNPHTQLVATFGGGIVWCGAVGEDMVELDAALADGSRRAALAGCLFVGSKVWDIIRPGPITAPAVSDQLSTVYGGDRPWLVLGRLSSDIVLAAPMNRASNPKWFAPVVAAADLNIPFAKDSQVELAHLWSLPSSPAAGELAVAGRPALEQATRKYFGI